MTLATRLRLLLAPPTVPSPSSVTTRTSSRDGMHYDTRSLHASLAAFQAAR